MSDAHHFSVAATWNPALREGTITNESQSFHATHVGAPSLGGRSGHTNPEELLLSAVSACFVQTWAIFLAKLKVPIEQPVVDATCRVEPDPAGGFHVTEVDLHPHVPAALWESQRADLEKTLSLAEKYCIVSKAVKREGRVTVTAKPV
jgi:organic hydroperoxide reductase OsmC/OhrA